MLGELSIKEFLQQTGSSAPVPGGGGIAALCGATGVSLAEMVVSLTIGKKSYAEVEEEMEQLKVDLEGKREDFLSAMDADAEVFEALMAALRLPKETEEEKLYRAEAVEKATKEAALAPLILAEKTLEVMEQVKFVLKKGNRNAASDAVIAAMLIRTSVLASLYNVKINLASIKDKAFVKEIAEKVDSIEKKIVEEEQQILKTVSF